MTIDAQPFSDAFKLFYPTILSTFVGYLLAGPSCLRLWIATQKAEAPPDHTKNASRTKLVLTSLVTGILVFVLEYALIFKASPQILDSFLFGVFGLVVFFGVTALFADSVGFIKRSVHRNNKGVPSVCVVKQKRNKKEKVALLSILVASTSFTIGAFVTGNTLLTALASTAVVYNMSRRVGLTSISIRGIIIGLIGSIAFTFLVCTAFFIKFISNPQSDYSHSRIHFTNTASSWLYMRSWVLTPVYAYFPGLLISLCLRFDYQRYLDTSDAAQQFILATHPAPEPAKGKATRIGEGVVIPSRAPTEFPKVYYITALVAWGVSQIAMLCLDVFTTLSLENEYEFSITTLCLELPVMVVALLAVAVLRGEMKAFWSYREVWTVKSEVEDVKSEAKDITVLCWNSNPSLRCSPLKQDTR